MVHEIAREGNFASEIFAKHLIRHLFFSQKTAGNKLVLYGCLILNFSRVHAPVQADEIVAVIDFLGFGI
jgi:hypothetical protein